MCCMCEDFVAVIVSYFPHTVSSIDRFTLNLCRVERSRVESLHPMSAYGEKCLNAVVPYVQKIGFGRAVFFSRSLSV